MVEYDPVDTELVLLTPESEGICQQGSHEYRVWDAIKTRGKLPVKELPVSRFFNLGTHDQAPRSMAVSTIATSVHATSDLQALRESLVLTLPKLARALRSD